MSLDKWDNKTGWVFDAYLSDTDITRYITSKNDLVYNFSNQKHGPLKSKSKVYILKEDKDSTNVFVVWNGNKIRVHKGYLSKTKKVKYNYPKIRKYVLPIIAQKEKNTGYHLVVNSYEDLYIVRKNNLFLVTYFDTDQDGYTHHFCSIWYEKNNILKEIKINESDRHNYELKLFDLNGDKYTDVIAQGGYCDGGSTIVVYKGGTKKMLKSIFDTNSIEYDDSKYPRMGPDPEVISLGKCENTVIEYVKKKYKFNCKKNKFDLL